MNGMQGHTMGDAAWHRGQLVERLRELAKQDADVFPVEDSINTLAADRIEALEAEKREAALEALAAQSQAFEHYERIKALEAALREAREVLNSIGWSRHPADLLSANHAAKYEAKAVQAIAKINEVLK